MRRSRRAGYTLLEMLLVVTILTVVAAAVTPAVVGRMSEYRLKEAVQEVHKALAATRIHAIDMTSSYQFRFEVGGRHYVAVPVDNDVVNAGVQSGSTTGTANTGSFSGAAVEVGELPEEFTFQTIASGTQSVPPPSTTLSTASLAMPSTLTEASNDPSWSAAVARVHYDGALSGLAWSLPIVFQPDGTATDAGLGIVDANGAGYQITVRELTGEILEQHLVTGVR